MSSVAQRFPTLNRWIRFLTQQLSSIEFANGLGRTLFEKKEASRGNSAGFFGKANC